MSIGSSQKASSLHVWQDNETDIDLLGFSVHSDLILSVITNPSVLPVTVGVFGDWGGGKSSIMKMLKRDLSDESVYPNVVCLYFNGWTFEGYEDAKSALLTSILMELGEHKRFGQKIKESVVKLLKRVKKMEVGKALVKYIAVPAAAAAFASGMGAAPAAAVAAATALLPRTNTEDEDEKTPINWSDLVEKDSGKEDLLGVRKFRDEFSTMLDKTDIKSLIVLIDDLDRCLPERLIETLEAIKLFVAVPKTAFVIGADPRIVRHAISTRYVKRQLHTAEDAPSYAGREEEEKLIQDYLEKLIQVPYQLPRLAPTEIETYLNLLACEKLLSAKGLATILSHWKEMRSENVFAPCTAAIIQDALGTEEPVPPSLTDQLEWSMVVAPVITDGLKGNPRQVKRMLNALSLRKQLASVARIQIKENILAKLMVLEYSNLSLFHVLNQWQTAEEGFPSDLKTVEALAQSEDPQKTTDDVDLKKWLTPSLRSWLRMKPSLADQDLRDYFWLARDRTGSTFTGVVFVSPAVQAALQNLLSENTGEQTIGLSAAQKLAADDLTHLIKLLRQDAERRTEENAAPKALHLMAVNGIRDAAKALIEVAGVISPAKLRPSIPQNIAEIAKHDGGFLPSVTEVLTGINEHSSTAAGRAAKSALATLAKKKG